MPENKRYILYKKIARGGMAEIYLGKQTGTDGFQRVCCIKRILPHYAQDQEFIRMFRDEAHICKRLQHANIARVEGFEEVEGSYAIIMEFVNGGDLRAVLSACEKAGSRLSVAMCVHIIAEAARGLHYAHGKVDELEGTPLEIVHRDISPQNILVSFEGEVKVTDFGIADADDKSTETRPGIVKGKYSYMSPEQISAKAVDARTDVFALAIVLWETLAMRRLFQGENEVLTIQKVRSCQIEYDIRSLNQNVDQELNAIVERGLKKDPRERFASAGEMERALRKYLSSRFSDFTMSDLGDFLKKIMATRRQEVREEIRNLLAVDSGAGLSAGAAPSAPQAGRTFSPSQVTPLPGPDREAAARSPSFALRGRSQIPGQGNSHAGLQGVGSQGGQTRVGIESMGSYGGGARQRHPGNFNGYTLSGTRTKGSALFSGGTSGGSRARGKTSRPGARARNGSLILVLLLLAIAGTAGVLGYQKYVLQPAPEGVELLITPAVVRVTLDGKALFGDKFIETPLKIYPIKGKGQYIIRNRLYREGPFQFEMSRKGRTGRLQFFKNGYSDEAFDFNLLTDGGQKYIVLERIADMAPTRLSLVNDGKLAWIKIDNGVIMGEIDYRKPLDAKDLTFGVVHKLYVYPFGFRTRKGAFVCKFSPRSQNWSAPYLVDINIDRQKCTYPLR